jgi:hypothetical protein
VLQIMLRVRLADKGHCLAAGTKRPVSPDGPPLGGIRPP